MKKLNYVYVLAAFAFFLLHPMAARAEGFDVPAEIPANQSFEVKYSDLTTTWCYVWRLQDSKGSYLHSTSSTFNAPCYKYDQNYSSFTVSNPTSKLIFDALAPDTYTLSLYRGPPRFLLIKTKMLKVVTNNKSPGLTLQVCVLPQGSPQPASLPASCNTDGKENDLFIMGGNITNVQNYSGLQGTLRVKTDSKTFSPLADFTFNDQGLYLKDFSSNIVNVLKTNSKSSNGSLTLDAIVNVNGNELRSNEVQITYAKLVSPSAPPPTPTPAPPSPPCANPAYGETNSYDPTTGDCSVLRTAVGDISTDPKGFIKKLFQILLSVSGGIALLLIIRGGYKYMTSQGNPEATKAAQEEITSAIVGLLFLVFSLVILQIIGIDLLHIPGLT